VVLTDCYIEEPAGGRYDMGSRTVVDANGKHVGHVVITEIPAEEYDITIGGTRVNNLNKGDVLGDGVFTFNPSTNMLIVKGVNLYPIQIEKILMQFPELASDYLITIETIGDNDEMTIEAELAQATDDFGMLQNLTKEITRRLKDELLFTPKVKLVGKGVIPQSDGKAKRVNDLRNNH
jgi:hypothetical protein